MLDNYDAEFISFESLAARAVELGLGTSTFHGGS